MDVNDYVLYGIIALLAEKVITFSLKGYRSFNGNSVKVGNREITDGLTELKIEQKATRRDIHDVRDKLQEINLSLKDHDLRIRRLEP